MIKMANMNSKMAFSKINIKEMTEVEKVYLLNENRRRELELILKSGLYRSKQIDNMNEIGENNFAMGLQ
jgi:hypothetical protein